MKLPVFIHWHTSEFSDEGGRYEVWHNDMSCLPEYALIHTTEIEFEPPPGLDGRAMLIEELKQKRNDLCIEFSRKVEKLDDKIQQLLALPNGTGV